jgi:catechol 2,3-dioxygenase-like lactoylglutathione lyase family enzyme
MEVGMSSTDVISDEATGLTSIRNVDANLEVIVIPVSDVDRAKEFYRSLGWRLDVDRGAGEDVHLIQFTPEGSGCSIQFGTNLTSAAPGSAEGLYLIVSDIEAARDDLVARDIEVSEVFHEGAAGARFHVEARTRLSGLAPDRGTYRSFASFSDPDGNAWLFQEVTSRLPGHVNLAATTFASASVLASALRRAAAAHSEHAKRIGATDADWPDWYAAYTVAEQAGVALPA